MRHDVLENVDMALENHQFHVIFQQDKKNLVFCKHKGFPESFRHKPSWMEVFSSWPTCFVYSSWKTIIVQKRNTGEKSMGKSKRSFFDQFPQKLRLFANSRVWQFIKFTYIYLPSWKKFRWSIEVKLLNDWSWGDWESEICSKRFFADWT